jgi:hypothetical protein
LANQLNKVVSNLLQKTGLQFDVNATFYNSSSLFSGNSASNSIDRTKVDFKLNRKFLDGKIIVTAGGDLDFSSGFGNVSATSQQLGNLQLLPDLTVEFILSKDRKVRAIVFSRNNLDISSTGVGRRNRMGASISYRKNFTGFFAKPKSKIPESKPKEDKAPIIPPGAESASTRPLKEEEDKN